EREQQRHRVDAERREVFPEDDLEVGRRQREQQLVGPLLAFLRPDRHRDRRDEEEEQVGEVLVERIEVGQVAHEEDVAPEGQHRRQRHEHRDEDVSGGRAEVGEEVPLEDGLDDMSADHRQTLAPSGLVSWAKTSSSGPRAFICCGVPSKTISPAWMKRTRSATASTSWRMWVDSRMVFDFPSSRMVARTSRIWFGSRPLVGSSMMRTSGSCSSAWAMPQRWR